MEGYGSTVIAVPERLDMHRILATDRCDSLLKLRVTLLKRRSLLYFLSRLCQQEEIRNRKASYEDLPHSRDSW